MNKLIEEINKIRKEQKCSINKLSKKSKLAYPSLYKVLNGQQTPGLDTFEIMIHTLGYEIAFVPIESED